MKKLFLISVVVSILLSACGGQESAPTELPPVTLKPSSTSTTISILTITPHPTLTPTQTLTLVPTWTFLPTLDSETGKEALYAWLEGSDNCRFPCWAGITPKNTTWEKAIHILQPLEGMTIFETRLNRPCIFGQCNYITWALSSDLNTFGNVYSKIEENTIHLVQLQIVDPYLLNAVGLQTIFNQYGKPSILLFSTEPDLPGDLFLELILVYPDQQFIIKFSKYAKLSDNQVTSCGQDSAIELIILDNKEQLLSMDTIANAEETKHLHVDSWHKPVEVATGITIDEFYETFRKANAPCVTTPTSVWRP